MNKMKAISFFAGLVLYSQVYSQALTSAMADGNSVHTSSGSSAISSTSSPSYSTSGTLPARARPEEAFVYQLQQVKEIAIKINARRMQKITSQMNSIQFNNPFQDKEPQSGFSDWNKEKSKYAADAENSDYSTLSSNTTSSRFNSGYVNYGSLLPGMTPTLNTDITEKELNNKSSKDIKQEYLQQVADKTIDETINGLEEEDVKARLISIKEIHNETYDLFEKMIDNFFKPYSADVQEEIDRFFGNYKINVFQSFLNTNPIVRSQTDDIKGDAHKVEMVFGVYNYLRL